MQCPHCRHGLTTVTHHDVTFNTCKACGGLWFDSHEVVRYLDRASQGDGRGMSPRKAGSPQGPSTEPGFCPRCNQLLEFHPIGQSDLYFRKCMNCKGVWVDRRNLSPLTRWFASASAYEQSPLYGGGNKSVFDLQEGSLTAGLLDLFSDDNPVRHFPWATLILVLLNTAIFVWSFFFKEQAAVLYLVPSEAAFALHTFLTSMFMHGDIFHLIGNMYCLWVFGDNIEDRLGKWKYLLLYLGTGICADLLYVATTTQPDIPTLGASGAVSGVMGAYLVLYPGAKIRINDTFFLRAFEYTMPAWLYIGVLFFGFQILYAWLNIPGVAWFAHIGGFAAGFASAFFMRMLNML